MKPSYEELERKVEQLAAENAGLKAACERVSMWNDFPQATLRSTGEVVPYVVAYGSNGERDYMRNIAATAVLKYTSETDAFLAEVRASAIKDALKSLDGVFDNDCVMESNGISYEDAEHRTAGAYAVSKALEEFADQVRKGVQS